MVMSHKKPFSSKRDYEQFATKKQKSLDASWKNKSNQFQKNLNKIYKNNKKRLSEIEVRLHVDAYEFPKQKKEDLKELKELKTYFTEQLQQRRLI